MLFLPPGKSYVVRIQLTVFFALSRSVLVKESGKAGEKLIDITPKEFSVRTVAQEYGGGAFQISGDTVIFSNYKDQRLYKQSTSSGMY